MEEVSVPRPEGAQEIINRWRPFNRGESPAAHIHQLYPTLLWMPVAVRAEGKGEVYVVSVPAYACKDELKQVVCLQLLCSVLVFFLSYCLILIRSLAGHYDYPEYDLPV